MVPYLVGYARRLIVTRTRTPMFGAIIVAAAHSNWYMFLQKDVICQDSDRRKQPDTAAPGFEVANAPYMQYKGQTLKDKCSKTCFPGPQKLS